MKFSLCIPMYNENKIIADTAKTLSLYLSQHFADGEYEILFSSDGSTDGCDKTVEALGLPNVRVVGYPEMDLPFVRVVGYPVNRGKGCAVRTAVMESTGDIVMFTDADLAYGTDVILSVIETLSQHPEAGMLIGSRNLNKDGYEGYTLIRRLASKLYIRVLCIAGGFRLSDSQCGCKAYRREAAQKIFSRCEVDGFAFDFETILWALKLGVKIVEMPVKVINHRESKVHVFRDTFRMLGDLRRMKKRIRKAEV